MTGRLFRAAASAAAIALGAGLLSAAGLAASGAVSPGGVSSGALSPGRGAGESSGGPPPPSGIPVGGLGPGGFTAAYDIRPLWNHGDLGQGQTLVFFEVDGYAPADLSGYAARFGLPAFASSLPRIGPVSPKIFGEAELDLEVAHAIAPDARLIYVNVAAFGGPVTAQFRRAFSTVARAYPGAIWSISLGQCETVMPPAGLAAANAAAGLAEQGGTTVYASSGDSGGLECLGVHQQDPAIPAQGISFPGDLPQVTSVGGTTLALTTAGRYQGEATWTEPLLSQGSTGGQSVVFQLPPWQRAPGVISSYLDGAICGAPAGSYCREVPDVSLDAAPATGAAVLTQGRWITTGGTSLATPVWAGSTALIDQYLEGRDERPVGFANPWLYRIAGGAARYPAFHDITAGTNDLYPAGPGYDMVTGLGSPDVWNLARDLAALTGRP